MEHDVWMCELTTDVRVPLRPKLIIRPDCTHRAGPVDYWSFAVFHTNRRCTCCGIDLGYGSAQMRYAGRHPQCIPCRLGYDHGRKVSWEERELLRMFPDSA